MQLGELSVSDFRTFDSIVPALLQRSLQRKRRHRLGVHKQIPDQVFCDRLNRVKLRLENFLCPLDYQLAGGLEHVRLHHGRVQLECYHRLEHVRLHHGLVQLECYHRLEHVRLYHGLVQLEC